MSETYIAIQVPMMPKETNRHGTIFGGVGGKISCRLGTRTTAVCVVLDAVEVLVLR